MEWLPAWIASGDVPVWKVVLVVIVGGLPGLLTRMGAIGPFLERLAERRARHETERGQREDARERAIDQQTANTIARLELDLTQTRADMRQAHDHSHLWERRARGADRWAHYYRHGWTNHLTAYGLNVELLRELLLREADLIARGAPPDQLGFVRDQLRSTIMRLTPQVAPPFVPLLEEADTKLPPEPPP